MSKNNFFNNDDEEDDFPSEDEIRDALKRGVPINDIQAFMVQLRRDSIREFNTRFKKDKVKLDPRNIDPSAKRWTEELMDTVIMMEEVYDIIKRTLTWSEDAESFILTDVAWGRIIDEICRNIFFKICEDLMDAGIFELRFDKTIGPSGDFTFVFTKKIMKKIAAADTRIKKDKVKAQASRQIKKSLSSKKPVVKKPKAKAPIAKKKTVKRGRKPKQ